MARIRPYNPRIHKKDTEIASKTIKNYLKPDRQEPRYIYSVGRCPRCKHETDNTRPLVVIGAEAPRGRDREVGGAAWGRARDVPEEHRRPFDLDLPADLGRVLNERLRTGELEFDVRCDCKVEHPKTPEGEKGCGSKFRLHVKW